MRAIDEAIKQTLGKHGKVDKFVIVETQCPSDFGIRIRNEQCRIKKLTGKCYRCWEYEVVEVS